jgi:hypothetical protein
MVMILTSRDHLYLGGERDVGVHTLHRMQWSARPWEENLSLKIAVISKENTIIGHL